MLYDSKKHGSCSAPGKPRYRYFHKPVRAARADAGFVAEQQGGCGPGRQAILRLAIRCRAAHDGAHLPNQAIASIASVVRAVPSHRRAANESDGSTRGRQDHGSSCAVPRWQLVALVKAGRWSSGGQRVFGEWRRGGAAIAPVAESLGVIRVADDRRHRLGDRCARRIRPKWRATRTAR
jgi:hypothetical protein